MRRVPIVHYRRQSFVAFLADTIIGGGAGWVTWLLAAIACVLAVAIFVAQVLMALHR